MGQGKVHGVQIVADPTLPEVWGDAQGHWKAEFLHFVLKSLSKPKDPKLVKVHLGIRLSPVSVLDGFYSKLFKHFI